MNILIFAGPVFLLGVVLLVRAIRGRVVSVHPHCRGCKFDLHGLTLSRESVCPECGRPTIPDTPTVMNGLRVFRRRLAVVAVLLMLFGAGGLAWPSVSKMPAMKNIDWYARFPEPMLLWLEGRGDKDALQVLHDQLIPGTLSDKGLQQLIARSLAMVDDESVPWDERWGDILVFSFLLDAMSKEEAARYLEGSFLFDLKVHEEVGFETESVQYTWIRPEPKRGTWSYSFLNALQQILPSKQYSGLITGFYDRFEAFRPYENMQDRRGGSFRGGSALGMDDYEGFWVPYQRGGSRSSIRLDLDLDRTEFLFTFPVQFTIYKEKAVYHEWSIEKKVKITRVENPQYLKPFIDERVIAQVAKSLEMSKIDVPVDPKQAKTEKDITSGVSSILHISCPDDHELGLLGKLVLDNGVEQIDFARLSIPELQQMRYGYITPEPYQSGRNWLDYFIDHESFWEVARKKGTIDVIYMPDLSAGLDDAQFELVINRKIVWRDVPIDDHEVRPMNYVEMDGTGREGVSLESTSQARRGEWLTSAEHQARREHLQPVAGELLEDD